MYLLPVLEKNKHVRDWEYFTFEHFDLQIASYIMMSATYGKSNLLWQATCDKIIWAASWQNQQNGMCTQRRLRSAWASAQSDQSLRCPHDESLGPQLPIEHTAKTLIRLGEAPGWSEYSLGAQSLCWFCHEVAHFSILVRCCYSVD